MNKISALTYGCRTNQYETICIVNQFLKAGWKFVPFNHQANIYLINTCTVTNRAAYKSRYAIQKALKNRAKFYYSNVIVTGCYSQLNYDFVAEMGPIDLIIDNNHKHEIFQNFMSLKEPEFKDISLADKFAEQSTDSMINKHRAMIKIQDGCDYKCAFCAVTLARGPSRSRDPQNILDQIEILTEKGYQEFILTGINLGLYGQDKKDGYHLAQLISDINSIPKVKKIRISSLEPPNVTTELLKSIARCKKVCSHFHLPMQSGSDHVLKYMGRNYSKAQFLDTCKAIKEIRPHAAIGVDVIAGLPGETEDYFNETRTFLENFPFAYFHVFPFSRRQGTKAYALQNQVYGPDIKSRAKILTKLSREKEISFAFNLMRDRVLLSAVMESKTDSTLEGVSDHYTRIHLQNASKYFGKMVKCRSINFYPDGKLVVEVIS